MEESRSPEAADRREIEQVLLSLDEFVEERGQFYGPGSKLRCVKTAIAHLKQVLLAANAPLKDFVSGDLLAPAVNELLKTRKPLTIKFYKTHWRAAFRWLCKKRFIALAYTDCVIPCPDLDPYDPYMVPSGFAEAWSGIFPKSIIEPRILASIAANNAVAPGVKADFRRALFHLKCSTPLAREYHWDIVRKMSREMGLNSLKEVGSLQGAKRLMGYFQRCGYGRDSRIIRGLQALFNALARAGLMGNPFKIKERSKDLGLIWVLDFQKLTEFRAGGTSRVIRGKRHKMVDARLIECRLREEDLRTIANYRNPALQTWRSQPAGELLEVLREAQENTIARIAVIFPPRPGEAACMNYRDWEKLEGSDQGDYLLFNNMRPNAKKRRSDWTVPADLIAELEELWALRRAAFARFRDRDNVPSFRAPMVKPGVALWINPSIGSRMSVQYLSRSLQRALVRMGIEAARAENATIYWLRRSVQTFARNRAHGRWDKAIAEQAGHSESVLKAHYDYPEATARAEGIRETLWAPLGVVKESGKPVNASGSGRQAADLSGAASIQGNDLCDLIAAIADPLVHGAGVQDTDLKTRIWKAAKERGLLCSFSEAADILNTDIRTLERWVESGHLAPAHLKGHRHLFRAQVDSIAQCQSPEEVGLLLGLGDPRERLSGRQVRNLVHAGRFPGAIVLGKKKILIPIAAVRAFQARRRSEKNFPSTVRKASANVAAILSSKKKNVSESAFH